MTCCICNRPLHDPKSVQAGIGPVCAARRAADAGRASSGSRDAIPALPWDPTTEDVVCERGPGDFDCRFNVAHRLVWHSPTGMDWGYVGSGPADFALNILYHFTRDETFSRSNHQDFKFHFVGGLPRKGGRIPGAAIREWIETRHAVETPESSSVG